MNMQLRKREKGVLFHVRKNKLRFKLILLPQNQGIILSSSFQC